MSAHNYTYSLTGGPIPEWGGYPFMAAITRLIPALHGRPSWQMSPIRTSRQDVFVGDPPKKKIQRLLDPTSKLCLRGITPEEAGYLEGKVLNIKGIPVEIGPLEKYQVRPSPRLVSRFVTFGTNCTEDDFVSDLVQDLPFGTQFALGTTKLDVIKGVTIRGWSVVLSDLSSQESMVIQLQGVGTGNTWGWGVFYPGAWNHPETTV